MTLAMVDGKAATTVHPVHSVIYHRRRTKPLNLGNNPVNFTHSSLQRDDKNKYSLHKLARVAETCC